MDKKWVISMTLGFFLAGCAGLGGIAQKESLNATDPSLIQASFASKEMDPFDTWKIYLNAKDPDGDMRYIVATISHPGMGGYPAAFIPIAKENAKNLSGYVFWNAVGSSRSTWYNFLDLTATVWIQDRAGHYSEPVSYTVSIRNRYVQEKPPEGVFAEKNLGPIMIRLNPSSGDDDNQMTSRLGGPR